MALSFIEPELWAIEAIGIFNLFCPCDLDLDLESMTFIYERDVEIHWMCKYELLTSRLSRFIV